LIGRALGLPPDELTDLVFVARVHDVGKIFIPERVLTKTGALTEEEFRLVKTHATVGAEIIGSIPRSETLRSAIAHHHETFDGTGYPTGLRGEEIPLWARILSVADGYANMTADRSFSPAKTSDQALQELEQLSGTRYDGMLVRILSRQLKAEKASSWGA
jgi:HD-GYP domain-containing protein (c-di-GMP phosphodiesterase class II)